MAHSINRHDAVAAIQKWFKGRADPLVAFPDKRGFPNVIYLYDENALEMIDDVAQLTAHLSVQMGSPVMVFIEPLYRAQNMAYTCAGWLKIYRE